MKRQLFLLITAFIFQCFSQAGEYSVFPKVHFQEASSWVSAQETCVDDDVILHAKKDYRILKYCDDNNANCTYVKRPYIQPIKSSKERCKRFENDVCMENEPYDFIQGPVIKVKIYPSEHDAEVDQNLKEVVPYRLPECADVKVTI